jgi:hypothetical protein
LRVYENILRTILKENYGVGAPAKFSEIEYVVKGLLLNLEALDVPILDRRVSRILYYMIKLKEIYKRDW